MNASTTVPPKAIPAISPILPIEQSPFLNLSCWRQFVARPLPEEPKLLEWDAYCASSEEDLRRFNNGRAKYIMNPEPVMTPQMKYVTDAALKQVRDNTYAAGQVRSGILVKGPAGVGKTTLVQHIARTFERRLREDNNLPMPASDGTDVADRPGFLEDGTPIVGEVVPVLTMTLAAGARPTSFSRSMVSFYDPRYSRVVTRPEKRYTESYLTDIVTYFVHAFQTVLVVVDEIHFLRASSYSGATTIDHLKDLANRLPITFLLSGIHADGFLNEGQAPASGPSSQISGRFRVLELENFNYYDPSQFGDWLGLITAFEQRLLLLRQENGSLARDHGEYLYQRTGGHMQSLVNLLRPAALKAIESGAESITRELLDEIVIDRRGEASSSGYNVGPTAKARGKKAKNAKAAAKKVRDAMNRQAPGRKKPTADAERNSSDSAGEEDEDGAAGPEEGGEKKVARKPKTKKGK